MHTKNKVGDGTGSVAMAGGYDAFWETISATTVNLGEDDLWPLPRLAFTSKETCQLLGGISPRSLRRLEQRGLLVPSRALRTKLYSVKSIQAYLEATK